MKDYRIEDYVRMGGLANRHHDNALRVYAGPTHDVVVQLRYESWHLTRSLHPMEVIQLIKALSSALEEATEASVSDQSAGPSRARA